MYGQDNSRGNSTVSKDWQRIRRGKEVIQRNTDIVQAMHTPVYGYLCLFILKSLANGEKFQSILNHMQHYGYSQGDWKDSI